MDHAWITEDAKCHEVAEMIIHFTNARFSDQSTKCKLAHANAKTTGLLIEFANDQDQQTSESIRIKTV